MLRILLCRRKHVIYQMCPGPKPYFVRVLNLNIECQIDKNKLNNSHEINDKGINARVDWGAMATRRSSRATRVCSAGDANYGGVMEVDPNELAVATYKLVVQSNTYEKNFVRPVS